VVTVEVNGIPETFDSIDEKFEFLDALYIELIDLAEKLNETSISFIVKRTYH
jgi:hypothetical protein